MFTTVFIQDTLLNLMETEKHLFMAPSSALHQQIIATQTSAVSSLSAPPKNTTSVGPPPQPASKIELPSAMDSNGMYY